MNNMPITCLTFNAFALVLGFNVALHLDVDAPLTWALMVLCGFFGIFPIARLRKLYLLIADIRPRPRVWPTAILADPQDGYPEGEDWRLIGVVTERR